MPIRLLLVDDHRLVLEGLRRVLEQEPDLEIVAQAVTGHEALELARTHAPDVVVLDVGLPDLSGVEVTRELCESQPGCKVLALTMHRDSGVLRQMLQAGALGYLLKDCLVEELIKAVRAVAAGQSYLCPVMTQVLVQMAREKEQTTSADKPVDVLTPRERDVLIMLARGEHNKEIAHSLGISVKTLDAHRRNIMKKLGIDSVVGLARYAIRQHMVELEEG